MYFFRSKDEAIARIGDMRWPEYFQSENLLELELHGTGQQTVVDTNWITFAPRANDGRLEPDELDWISKYWAGELYCKSPVWELVANGVALVLDTDVRRRCFEYVKTKFSEFSYSYFDGTSCSRGRHSGWPNHSVPPSQE